MKNVSNPYTDVMNKNWPFGKYSFWYGVGLGVFAYLFEWLFT